MLICVAGLLPFCLCAQEAVTTACRQPVPFQTVTRSRSQGHISPTNGCVPNTGYLGLAQLFFGGKMVSVVLCWFAASEDLPCSAATVWSGGTKNVYALEIKSIWRPSQVTKPGLSGGPFISSSHGSIFALQELSEGGEPDLIEHFNYNTILVH